MTSHHLAQARQVFDIEILSSVDAPHGDVGIINDGDLRRHMASNEDILAKPLSKILTRNPIVIREDALAAEALWVFDERETDDLINLEAEYHHERDSGNSSAEKSRRRGLVLWNA